MTEEIRCGPVNILFIGMTILCSGSLGLLIHNILKYKGSLGLLMSAGLAAGMVFWVYVTGSTVRLWINGFGGACS